MDWQNMELNIFGNTELMDRLEDKLSTHLEECHQWLEPALWKKINSREKARTKAFHLMDWQIMESNIFGNIEVNQTFSILMEEPIEDVDMKDEQTDMDMEGGNVTNLEERGPNQHFPGEAITSGGETMIKIMSHSTAPDPAI